jgi:hypothetical protein
MRKIEKDKIQKDQILKGELIAAIQSLEEIVGAAMHEDRKSRQTKKEGTKMYRPQILINKEAYETHQQVINEIFRVLVERGENGMTAKELFQYTNGRRWLTYDDFKKLIEDLLNDGQLDIRRTAKSQVFLI